jgi:thioredoxin 1
MKTNFRLGPMTCLLACVLPTLVSCDKLTELAITVENMVKRTPPAPTQPKVPGIYTPEQVSDIKKAEYPGFVARTNALVVVDFHATWCGPCQMLAPVLVKATEAHPGVMYLGRVDIDEAADLAAEQKVSSVPDVRIFRNGAEVGRFVGFPGEKEVLEKMAVLSRGLIPPKAVVAPLMKPSEKGWMPPGMTKRGIAPVKKPELPSK